MTTALLIVLALPSAVLACLELADRWRARSNRRMALTCGSLRSRLQVALIDRGGVQVGSLRFRRSVKIAPGVRLNFNKRSVGISAGVRGARYSVNSSGRRTSSVGIPGTGLSYRTQSGGRRRRATADDVAMVSPTRLTAHTVGVVTFLLFLIGIIGGHPHFAGVVAGIGIVVYVLLRVLRGVLDPLFLWLLARRSPREGR